MQSWVVATETMWPTILKILTMWIISEKVCWPPDSIPSESGQFSYSKESSLGLIFLEKVDVVLWIVVDCISSAKCWLETWSQMINAWVWHCPRFSSEITWQTKDNRKEFSKSAERPKSARVYSCNRFHKHMFQCEPSGRNCAKALRYEGKEGTVLYSRSSQSSRVGKYANQ